MNINRETLDDIYRRLNKLEDRLFELEGYMPDYLDWAKRRRAILQRAKRQRGRKVIALFP